MSVAAVCVDKARVVKRVTSGSRVDGKTVYTEQNGTWFRCRLTINDTSASEDQVGKGRAVRTQPKLLFIPKDTAGQPVLLNAEDRVEVSSVQLGDAVWDVDGDPTPLRKKRSVIGYEVSLVRVLHHQGS